MEMLSKGLFRENEAHLISFKHLTFKLILLFVSGVLFSVAFPSFSLSFLGWIGVIPLYLLIKDLKPLKAFIFGLVWGYGWALATFFWLRKIEPFIPYAMALVLAFFSSGIWAYLVALTRKNILIPNQIRLLGHAESKKYLIENKLHLKKIFLVLLLSSFWCFAEWLRGWIFDGFPWNYLAVTQHKHYLLIQIASITGIYGVSFVVIFANLAIAEFIQALFNSIRYKVTFYTPPVLYIAILLILLNGLFGYFAIKDFHQPKTEKVNLKPLLVQGDIPQIRFYSPQQAVDALTVYVEYSEKILPQKPDILIWPESAVPQLLLGESYLSKDYRSIISRLIREYQVPIILGTVYYENGSSNVDEAKAYNSALLINKKDEIEAIYSKMHLVPWGEYTPGENIFPLKYIYPWIKKNFGMGRSLTPGNTPTIFNIKEGIRASVLICFEDSYSYIARQHIMNGSNLIITITNDAWFPDSDEPSQHIAEAVFRSVENRRTMIRSGNNSGTCVINPLGIITDSIFKEEVNGKEVLLPDKQGRGTVIFNLEVDRNPPISFYTKYGNVFIVIINLIGFLGLLWSFFQWKERKMRLYKLITNTKE